MAYIQVCSVRASALSVSQLPGKQRHVVVAATGRVCACKVILCGMAGSGGTCV